jgi:hypothetical protein
VLFGHRWPTNLSEQNADWLAARAGAEYNTTFAELSDF